MIGAALVRVWRASLLCDCGTPALTCWSRSRTIIRIHSGLPTFRRANRSEWPFHDLVFEDGDKAFAEASVIRWKHVTQPMKRLHETHADGQPSRAARSGGLEVECEVAEFDGRKRPSVRTPIRAGTASVRPRSLAREAIDTTQPCLPGQRVDHVARI